MRGKRFFSLLLTIVLCVGMIPATASAETYGDLSYIVSGGEVTITDCDDAVTSVTIPDEIEGCPVTTIGESAFFGCGFLTSVTIPGSVTTIENSAFFGCRELTNVTIPGSVTTIETSAFSGCSGLTDVTISDGVTTIKHSAFSDCIGLTNVTIPASVNSIWGGVFAGCSSLQSITVAAGNTAYQSIDGVLCSKDGTTLVAVPDGKSGAYTIPGSVTTIGEDAFADCSGLTSVTIPDSVTTIESSAFWGCSGLTDVTIPDSVTAIKGYAFHGCSGLTSVTIPDSVTTIEYFAFSGCSGLTSVTIPGDVTAIKTGAFEDCSSLTGVTIPANVSSIEDGVFAGCGSLQSITVDTGNAAYESVDGVLYSKDGNVLIAVPGGRSGAYVIPGSVTAIEDRAFSGCSSLTGVTIPNSVTTIGSGAFEDCSSLTGVTIPSGVTTIEEETFSGCSSLTGVTIPDSVTTIERAAFWGCSSLTSVTIPDGVTAIKSFTFWECSGLTDVTIPDSVTTIERGAFSDCSSLISVTIPDGVTTIESSTFMGCRSLTSVTIPESVTDIKSSVFWGCVGLNRIIFVGSAPGFHSYAFGSVTATAYYPGGNPTWTESVQQNYGGRITWMPYDADSPIKPWGHTHSFTDYKSNNDATCTEDGTKTAKCDYCDETNKVTDEGSALGHDWADATCTAPKTCKNCSATEGSALGHDFSGNAEYCKHDCGTKNPDYQRPTVRPTRPTRPVEPTKPAKPENPFVDMPDGKYFTDAVIWAVENGITGGKDATHFDPYASCTRGQLVTFLWRAAGKPAAKDAKNFSDVAAGRSCEKAVLWAAENGIVTGYADGTFRPDAPVTRQQVAAILWRYAKYAGMDVSVGEDTNILSYNDALTVSEYAIPAMQWACGAGVLQGNDGDLLPTNTCTRAQIVTMLYRLLAE